MVSKLVSSTQITLVDLNDAIISGTEPANPTVGALWIKNSVNPSELYRYSGSAWVFQTLSLAALDPEKSDDVENSKTTLANLASDSAVTRIERDYIRDKVTEIIGSILTNTGTMPTLAVLDAGTIGEVHAVREEARNAAILTSDAAYVAVGTTYTTLSGYLNAMTPKPWDTLSDTTITIVAATWRDNWLKYYEAVANLRSLITTKLKQNGDAANALLADIANDNKLTASEKQSVQNEWNIITGEKASIDAQADLYKIVTEKTTYTNAYNALNTYLNVTASPNHLLANLSTTSDIVGTTFRANFKAYYDARISLLKKSNR